MPSLHQFADVMTKGLPVQLFTDFRFCLCVLTVLWAYIYESQPSLTGWGVLLIPFYAMEYEIYLNYMFVKCCKIDLHIMILDVMKNENWIFWVVLFGGLDGLSSLVCFECH
jgi:hypothetical protein